MTRPYLALVPRRTLAHWTRQRLVDIHAELSALRMDHARLLRRCTQMGRCDRCKTGGTVTIQDSGFWYCRKCQLNVKEVRA